MPLNRNLTEDQILIRDTIRGFAEANIRKQSKILDEKEEFSYEITNQMSELGLLGAFLPSKYGGAGLDYVSYIIAVEELARVDSSQAATIAAHNSLGTGPLYYFGNEEQKEKYLPKLISGEHIGCMGMSEPEYGSDAVGIQTKAEKKDDHYLLNGTKMWITNAEYADVAYVYTRTGKERKNLSTFIVDKGAEGFSIGKPIHKMGMRASPTGELVFDNCKIPHTALVGNEGDSIYHMMKNLELERITIAGISLGIAQACVDQCVKYAGEREQFGKSLGNYQMIQKMIAEMATETEMMRRFLYTVAKEYDDGKKGPMVAAQVKLQIPKMATKIALDAIQLHGGYGYSREFPVERMMRDNKLNEIGAGTNEVMIMIIAKELLALNKTAN